jgi:hypothetical protein
MVLPTRAMTNYGRSGYIAPLSQRRCWMAASGHFRDLVALSLGKNPGSHWIGDLVGLRGDMGVLDDRNLLPVLGFEPRMVQSVP